MSELKISRILYLVAAGLTLISAIIGLTLGILFLASSQGGIYETGGSVLLILGIILAIFGAVKIWCAKEIKAERNLTAVGVLGLIFGIISWDILSFVAGILSLAGRNDDESSSKKSSKGSKKSNKKSKSKKKK